MMIADKLTRQEQHRLRYHKHNTPKHSHFSIARYWYSELLNSFSSGG